MKPDSFFIKTSCIDKYTQADSKTSVIDFTIGLENSLWRNRDFYQLNYTPMLVDLYRLASAVYIADKRVPRNKSYDGWTRDIFIQLPVSDLNLWQKNIETINKLCSFLTGDHWKIAFTKDQSTPPNKDESVAKKGHSLNANAASLFSGGLDSFIGTADHLNSSSSLALIAHYDHGITSKIQENVFNKLKDHYKPKELELIQFFIQVKQVQENTTRSRSFLFLSLGTLVAASTSVKNLIVPENGFISLNVPLTYGRFGSLSTKTTHPYSLKLFNNLLKDLGINVNVIDPYQFKTKGEMIADSKDIELIKAVGAETMSCAHATAGRWDGHSPNKHCGYCLPCLIRRAAFHKNDCDSKNDYVYDVLEKDYLKRGGKKTADLQAILHSTERYKTASSRTSVLRTGPICPSAKIDDFCRVYDNGIKELKEFLGIND
ncbi:MAG: Qat anti-phage system QueC-like protein QatC [Patescibacteria group bacterium]